MFDKIIAWCDITILVCGAILFGIFAACAIAYASSPVKICTQWSNESIVEVLDRKISFAYCQEWTE